MPARLLYAFPEPLPMRKARAIQVVHTVDALARAGVKIDFAYVPVAAGSDPFLPYGLTCHGNVRLVPLSRSLPWPFNRLRIHSNRLFFWRLHRWLEKRRGSADAPSAIFVRHVKLGHALLQIYPSIPLIYEAHEIFSQSAPQLYQYEKTVIERSAVLIAIGGILAETINRYFGVQRQVSVVPSATALPKTQIEKNWREAGQRIVYAGSLYGWKGVDDLIAAAAMLTGCRITVIGGEAKTIIRLGGMLAPTGAEVIFTGHLSHEQVQQHLRQACIAVLPNRSGSVSEYTSPLKLFEYMAAGCAIVASDLPVIREILEEDECAWFIPGNPASLGHAIHRLVSDTQLAQYMAERAQRKVESYSWDKRAERLLEAIRTAAIA